MFDTRISFRFFADYDCSGIIEYLNKMATKGWILKSKGGIAYKFIKTDKKFFKYDITFFADANKDNDWQPYKSDVYLEIRQSAGWHLLTNDRKMMIFITENPDATPLETDAVSMVEVVHHTMIHSYLPQKSFLVVLWLWQRSFFDISLFNIVLISVYMITAIEIIWYIKWYLKAKKLAQEYDVIHKTKTPWIVMYVQPILFVILLVWLVIEMEIIGVGLIAFMAYDILKEE